MNCQMCWTSRIPLSLRERTERPAKRQPDRAKHEVRRSGEGRLKSRLSLFALTLARHNLVLRPVGLALRAVPLPKGGG
jgi:hypothetical protein